MKPIISKFIGENDQTEWSVACVCDKKQNNNTNNIDTEE